MNNVFLFFACIVLVLLVLLLYVRIHQGDQRTISVTNQMFLPLLSALVITLGALYNQGDKCAQGPPGDLRYLALTGVLLIMFAGVLLYALNYHHDRRILTDATLFSVILVLLIFAITQVVPCG
ncbi:MAG TPA: hypothetical protein VFA41_06405 [Ktedonobacteraceae bacterium]|jgi:drug/metabolite transporter (DMT)-like permease|nr:hypothetical protein [Ktedonobacteraceae bacterium]